MSKPLPDVCHHRTMYQLRNLIHNIHTYLYTDSHKHSHMHTNIHTNRYTHVHNKLYGPFLWIGFNKIKAVEPSRTPFTFNYVII